MAFPSEIKREAVKAAIRQHPAGDAVLQSLYPGRKASDLGKDELQAVCTALSLDKAAIEAAAVPSLPAGAAPMAGVPEPFPGLHPVTGTTDVETETAVETEQQTHEPVSTDTTPDTIENELTEIRSLIVTGGLAALDEMLRDL